MTPPSDSPATRGQITSWALFDFANTAFYVLILTVGYPLYFKEVVAAGNPAADLLWGSAFSISMFITALLSPILGAAADSGTGKKWFLGIFTAICVLATSGLYFVQVSMLITGIVLLILANVGFEAGLVFYDAFLPEITTERSYGRVSGYGFALGYAGSLVTLAVTFPLYRDGFVESNLFNIRLSFLVAAGFFLIFALPIFLFLPDRQRTSSHARNFVSTGFERVRSTFREIERYRNIARFLLAYFLYIDAINTIIVFSSIYARETLQLEISDIVIFFAIVQTFAIAGSVVFGILSDHAGHKRTLTATLLLWIAIVVMSYFIRERWLFYILGGIAGVALGSSQSTSRSLMSEITPTEKKTEFFGFYSFFGKASAILGPVLFGLASSLSNQRIALLLVGGLLAAGLILVQRVQEARPAGEALPLS